MCERVAIDSLVDSAVNAEICLPVTIQIKFAQSDALMDRFLEDSRSDAIPVPCHFARKASIHRYELHPMLVLIRCVHTNLPTQYSELF